MKTLRQQRRLASSVLHVGRNKVWLDSSRISEIKEAITRADILDLVKDGAIKKQEAHGTRRRIGALREKRQKKRKRNVGGVRKKVGSRKQDYVKSIRKVRKYALLLKKQKNIDARAYREIRKLAKAGKIKTKKDVKAHLKTKGIELK